MLTKRTLLMTATGLLVGYLAAGQTTAPAAPPATAADTLFWILIGALVLVLLVFVLFITMIAVQMKPQLRRLYELPTVHDTWSGKVLGLVIGEMRLVTGEHKDEQMAHNYDGITEFDNDLPPWWKYGFYFTIVFAIGYLYYYQVAKIGQLQTAEYATEMQQATLLVSADADDPNKLTTFAALTAPTELGAGKSIFATNCAPCHGASAEGKVGPNLTDDYWLHGGEINHVYKTIKFGVSSKGMVAWKGKLAGKQILQVASYIRSLHGSKPANAKPPQGEKEVVGKPVAKL